MRTGGGVFIYAREQSKVTTVSCSVNARAKQTSGAVRAIVSQVSLCLHYVPPVQNTSLHTYIPSIMPINQRDSLRKRELTVPRADEEESGGSDRFDSCVAQIAHSRGGREEGGRKETHPSSLAIHLVYGKLLPSRLFSVLHILELHQLGPRHIFQIHFATDAKNA